MVKTEVGEQLQEEAGAMRSVQRRRVGEAGDAALDEVQLLRLNMEAQSHVIHWMERTRVLEEELQRAKADISQLAADSKVQDTVMQAKDDQLQAKNRELYTNDLLLQAQGREIILLHADIARLKAGSAICAETLFQEGQRLCGEQRFSEAAERWGQAALLQQGPSHAHLSDMLIYGRPGVAKDGKRAFELAVAGAALGCVHSKAVLGCCYVLGRGVAVDKARGLALGRESEAAGSCFGQFVVGLCYYNGWGGVAKDYAEAVRLFSLAAKQGHAAAQSQLGVMFIVGKGVAKDCVEALRLFSVAAVQGLAIAQVHLGSMLWKGQGVARDCAEGLRFFRLAAAQGYEYAQVCLGRMYEKGRGVARDYAEAVRLYSLAVTQGNATAQNNLGLMFEKGRGVAQDLAEAVRLYRLAAAQGCAVARENLEVMAIRRHDDPAAWRNGQ